MTRKRVLPAIAVAGLLLAGVLAASSAHTTAAHATVTRVTGGRELHLGHFTFKPEVQVASTTYYEMVSGGAGQLYCLSTNGNNVSGDDVVLEGCSTSSNNDLWAIGFWPGGSWSGYAYVFSKANNNNCLDDAGGAENIRLPIHTCGEVGGMSWYVTSTNEPSGGNCVWENAINVSNFVEPILITDDLGDQFPGAWVVAQYTQNQGSGWPFSQQWGGLDDWGGGCIDG